MNLEIDRMLCMSTSHLRDTTCNEWLAGKHEGITAYQKGEYGWFVYAGAEDSYQWETNGDPDDPDIPNELKLCIAFAREHDCAWITFDRDGEIVEGLVVFNW